MLSQSLQKSKTPETTMKRSQTESYRWKPLISGRNEFRLVQLQEASYEDGVPVIVASIHNVPGNGHPSYIALSYTWSQLERTVKIMLDQKVHYITEHLHNALLTSIAHGVTHMWVDALCIDQDDPDEKAAQVQRMATIFQEADHVMIWLGSSPNIERVIGSIKNLNQSTTKQEFWAQALIEQSPYGFIMFNEDFIELLDSDYWHRTWIVQEIAVARRISLFCGKEQIDGTVFESLFSLTCWNTVRTTGRNSPSIILVEHIVSIWNIRKSFRTRQPMHFLGLLLDVRNSETSLSLDRVYAIYGLAFDQRAFLTEPNYTFTSTRLCSRMTKRFIETTDSLDIILLTRFSLDRSLPSWCCPFLDFGEWGWNHEILQHMIDYINGKLSKLRCGELRDFWNTTSSGPVSDKQILWEDQTMKVVGIRLGNVTGFKESLHSKTSGNNSQSNVNLELSSIFDSISRLLMIHSHLYDQHERSRQLVLAILEKAQSYMFSLLCYEQQIFAKNPTPESKESSSILSENFDELGDFIFNDIATMEPVASSVSIITDMLRVNRERVDLCSIPNITPEEIQHAETTVSELLGLYQPAQFFLVDYKNVGLINGTWSYRPREVWLLSHCSMPVILNKISLGKDASRVCYRIISEAHIDRADIHGKQYDVMNGDAWKAAKPDDFERINII